MIASIIKKYETATLDDISSVSLMNRIDSKYLISLSKLCELLNILQKTHQIVEINNLVHLPYKTLYFDTEDFYCYHRHHNGKLNRYKYRTREYLSTNVVFNEVKHKINTGKTKKSRIKRKVFTDYFDKKFSKFATDKSPEFKSGKYLPKLFVNYN